MSRSADRNWLVVLAIVYVALYITTPYNSNRLAFLATIRFERILAAIYIFAALVSGRLSRLLSVNAVVVVGFTTWLYICAFVSPYKALESATHWRNNHWEILVFFALVAVSLRSPNDLRCLIRCLVYIVLAYQLYSWIDFLQGGSYVWQQGFKRMIGTWSGGGIGAANAWGLLGVWILPFCVEIGLITGTTGDRRIAYIASGLCLLSVVYSGTRGAMLTAVLYLIARFRRQALRPRPFLLAAVAILVGALAMPSSLRSRYWDQVIVLFSDPQETDIEENRFAKISEASARGRIEGLWDGFAIAAVYPVFGCGPGASPVANRALETNTELEEDGVAMQLHNLWGQVVAEAGFPGLLLWCALLLVVASPRVGRGVERTFESEAWTSAQRSIRHSILIMIVYGFAGHTLYDFKWMFLFAAACVPGYGGPGRAMNRRQPSAK